MTRQKTTHHKTELAKKFISIIGLAIALTLWGAPIAPACDVPVFRYALEFWPADPYELYILHDGPLTGDQQTVVDHLRKASVDGTALANFLVEVVDLGQADGNTEASQSPGLPPEAVERLRGETAETPLPCMLLRFPRVSGNARPVWQGPLTAQNAHNLIDSPVRKAIARDLLAGKTAVWVLLESGDDEEDVARGSHLDFTLKALEKTLEIPDWDPSALAESPARTGQGDLKMPELTVDFSTVQLSRNRPEEAFLIAMLMQSEPDLERYANQPMVFPIYGRGLILYGLIGGGVTEENISEAARFLVGECSCEVKELNPGTDLLIAADWAEGLKGGVAQTLQMQSLVSLAALAQGETEASAPAINPIESTATPSQSNPLGRNILLALSLIIAIILGVAFAISRRSPEGRS